MRIFANAHYDFIRWRWYAIGLSAVLIVAGLLTIAARGLPLGVDFTGGTIIVLKFDKPVSEDMIRGAIESLPGEEVVQQYGGTGSNEILIRLPQVAENQEAALEESGSRALALIDKANVGKYEVRSRDSVGPVIGADLQRKGIYATLASILGITIYIAWRFRFSFAVGAIAATFHDILVVVAFLTFFRYELSLNVVAAILTITGYSVNDTIVIFDRVRENLRSMRRDSLTDIVNMAVNQTLGRTLITAGTTFLAVLSLYVLGGEVLRGFAFAMLVGIVSGTYSTVYIASAIAILLSGRKAAPRVAAAPAAAETPRRQGKPGRNVRVS
jgi:preprotein translocase subunit SecF